MHNYMVAAHKTLSALSWSRAICLTCKRESRALTLTYIPRPNQWLGDGSAGQTQLMVSADDYRLRHGGVGNQAPGLRRRAVTEASGTVRSYEQGSHC